MSRDNYNNFPLLFFVLIFNEIRIIYSGNISESLSNLLQKTPNEESLSVNFNQ